MSEFARQNSKSAPATKFQETKTGLVGLKRDTMLQSELQYLVYISSNLHWNKSLIEFWIKPQLGKTKNRGHRLPPKDFTYGVANHKLDGGVPEGKSLYVAAKNLNLINNFSSCWLDQLGQRCQYQRGEIQAC